MTNRERIVAAAGHNELPADLGGCGATSIAALFEADGEFSGKAVQ